MAAYTAFQQKGRKGGDEIAEAWTGGSSMSRGQDWVVWSNIDRRRSEADWR